MEPATTKDRKTGKAWRGPCQSSGGPTMNLVADLVTARTVSKLLHQTHDMIANHRNVVPGVRAAADEAERLANLISTPSAQTIRTSVTGPIGELSAGSQNVSVGGVQMKRSEALVAVRYAAQQLGDAWNIRGAVE